MKGTEKVLMLAVMAGGLLLMVGLGFYLKQDDPKAIMPDDPPSGSQGASSSATESGSSRPSQTDQEIPPEGHIQRERMEPQGETPE